LVIKVLLFLLIGSSISLSTNFINKLSEIKQIVLKKIKLHLQNEKSVPSLKHSLFEQKSSAYCIEAYTLIIEILDPNYPLY
jgi:hypothetical protein